MSGDDENELSLLIVKVTPGVARSLDGRDDARRPSLQTLGKALPDGMIEALRVGVVLISSIPHLIMLLVPKIM